MMIASLRRDSSCHASASLGRYSLCVRSSSINLSCADLSMDLSVDKLEVSVALVGWHVRGVHVNEQMALSILVMGYGATLDAHRVTDGARTRDLRDHNPMLCQLSYGHQAVLKFYQQAPGVQSSPGRPCLLNGGFATWESRAP